MAPDVSPQGQEPKPPASEEQIITIVTFAHGSFPQKIDHRLLGIHMFNNNHEELAGPVIQTAGRLDRINPDFGHAYILGASFIYQCRTLFLRENGLPIPPISDDVIKEVNDDIKKTVQDRERARIDLTTQEFDDYRRALIRKEIGNLFPYLATLSQILKLPETEIPHFLNGAEFISRVLNKVSQTTQDTIIPES